MSTIRLFRLMSTMQIPTLRRDISKPENIRWLLRNIAIYNGDNVALKETVQLLKVELQRVERENGGR